MGAPFRRVAPPFRWEMVLGSYLGVEDHHPRDHAACGWSPRCVFVACSVWPRLRPIQHASIGTSVRLVCARLWVPGGEPGTAVTVCRVRVRQCRARAGGLPEARARARGWCSGVLVGQQSTRWISAAYRVGTSYIGRGASISRV